MKTGLYVGARAIAMAVTAALLSNCGASQTPIGAPVNSSYRGATAQRAPSSPTYSTIYNFSGRRHAPHHPDGGVIMVGGTLYGTTHFGGANHECFDGCGTVYALTTTGTFTVLHKFHGGPKDGHYPVESLTDVDGTLYGITADGGEGTACQSGCGTVYSITTSGKERLVYSFAGSSDGAHPDNSLLDVNGTLFGTTNSGGSSNDGTIFAISPTGAETVLHSFAGEPYDGSSPSSELVDIRGTLYGTTASGGADNHGTVFSIAPSGAEAVLYSFKGGTGDGTGPDSLIAVKDKLFGTTAGGGAGSPKHCYGGCGVFFSLSTTGNEKVLHSFQFREGAGEKNLVEGGGALYGTARGGSMYKRGTVFTISFSGVTTVLHAFVRERGRFLDGRLPVGQLFFDNGTLYGVTQRGGHGENKGTVYALAL